MSTVVESAKLLAYTLAMAFPRMVHAMARYRYRSVPSPTDIWVFKPGLLKKLSCSAGFAKVRIVLWHLVRPMMVQKFSLHLTPQKTMLSEKDLSKLRLAIEADGFLNRFLPARFFGSICLICEV